MIHNVVPISKEAYAAPSPVAGHFPTTEGPKDLKEIAKMQK